MANYGWLCDKCRNTSPSRKLWLVYVDGEEIPKYWCHGCLKEQENVS